MKHTFFPKSWEFFSLDSEIFCKEGEISEIGGNASLAMGRNAPGFDSRLEEFWLKISQVLIQD